jgi:urease accessory protein
LRARFPNAAETTAPEAVLINTAGGLTGGDSLDVSVTLSAGAAATVTTAAAEKIYRAREGKAAIAVKLAVAAGANLAWLPQPTILFERACLDRRCVVELGGSARLLAVEMLIFGRAAMGEEVHTGAIRDAWRVQRDGRLVFADTFRLEGAVAAALNRAATLDGKRALAMLIYAAADAGKRLAPVRAMLAKARSLTGASSWNGLLLVRVLAHDGRALLADLVPLIEFLHGRPVPRVWQC